jgi:hypothetical protein
VRDCAAPRLIQVCVTTSPLSPATPPTISGRSDTPPAGEHHNEEQMQMIDR